MAVVLRDPAREKATPASNVSIKRFRAQKLCRSGQWTLAGLSCRRTVSVDLKQFWLKCCFTSTETVGLFSRDGSPGRPPRPWHSSWASDKAAIVNEQTSKGGRETSNKSAGRVWIRPLMNEVGDVPSSQRLSGHRDWVKRSYGPLTAYHGFCEILDTSGHEWSAVEHVQLFVSGPNTKAASPPRQPIRYSCHHFCPPPPPPAILHPPAPKQMTLTDNNPEMKDFTLKYNAHFIRVSVF